MICSFPSDFAVVSTVDEFGTPFWMQALPDCQDEEAFRFAHAARLSRVPLTRIQQQLDTQVAKMLTTTTTAHAAGAQFAGVCLMCFSVAKR
jgi:hypothetical protein